MDGRQNFDTSEIENFAGLNTTLAPTKAEYNPSMSPMQKNVFNIRGVLESRQGRERINYTAYASIVTSLVRYVDRHGTENLVFSVKSTASVASTPNGTLQVDDFTSFPK